MSLFERIREKRINLNEQTFSDKQKSDMKKLLNKNFGSKEISKKTADTQKQLAKDNKKMFDVTGKSAVKDAKKYASGEYPKIGGGQRIGSKSKGPGAETGAKVNLNPTSGSKSKGTTPVKVNITKPIKQSEVSKKAKEYTQKIDKMRRAADRSVKKQYPDSSSLQAMKSDIDTRSLIKKAGGTGDIGYTAPDRPKKIQKRITRAIKQGTPDPFDIDTSKASKDVAKDFGTKPVKGGLDMGKSTTPRKITKKFVNTKPSDIKLPKSYSKFDRDLQDYKDRNKATMRTEPVKKVSKPDPNVTRQDVGMAPKSTPKPKTTNVFKKVTAATSGKKVTNSKGIGNKYRGQENKAAKDARINLDRASSGMGGGKPPKKPPTKSGTLGFPDPDKKPKKIVKKFGPDSTGKVNPFRSGQSKYGANPIVKVLKKSKNPLAKQAYKTGLKLGPGGRALVKKGGLGGVAVAGLLSSPTVRKFAKGALTGAGIGFLAGNKKQQKLVTGPNVNIRKKFSLSPGEKGGFSTSKS